MQQGSAPKHKNHLSADNVIVVMGLASIANKQYVAHRFELGLNDNFKSVPG